MALHKIKEEKQLLVEQLCHFYTQYCITCIASTVTLNSETSFFVTMATAFIPADLIEKELTCSICLNLLREPKDLDCPHTYCFECLVKYVHGKSTIECPECRQVTLKPGQGLAALKTNLRLKNMVDNFTKGACPRINKSQMEVPICPNHFGECQHFFCVTCNVGICHICRFQHPSPQHRIREWKEVQEAEENRRIKKQKLGDLQETLKSAKAKAEADVQTHVQHLFTQVKSWELKMNQDIQVMYQKRARILQQKQNGLDRPIWTKWNRPVTSGINALSIQQDDALPHDMTSIYLKRGQLNFSSFGEIRTTGKPNNKQATNMTNEIRKLKLSFLTEFGNNDQYRIESVVSNCSSLIGVVSWNCIGIYGKYNGEYVQQSRLEFGNEPSAVAISSQGKFLVCEERVMKIFSPDGVREWSWPNFVDAKSITVTLDDMVVIGRGSSKTIAIHHGDGKLVRTHPVGFGQIGLATNGKGIAFIADNLGSVVMIDFVTGRTLWAVNLSDPVDICYEPKSNTFLVLGHFWDKDLFMLGIIHQYCSTTGRLMSSVKVSDLQDPSGMTVTQDSKLVLFNEQKIQIYNIV